MGGALERGVDGLVVPSEHDRLFRTDTPSAFWAEMHRLADEQCLFALARLEFLQERLFWAIDRRYSLETHIMEAAS